MYRLYVIIKNFLRKMSREREDEIRNLETGNYIEVCEKIINHIVKYSVKIRCTTTNPDIIQSMQSDINNEPERSWYVTYYVSDYLLERQEFPRESNGLYFWKNVKSDVKSFRNLIYTSLSMPHSQFLSKLKKERDLIEIKVSVSEYGFQKDSPFEEFKYRTYIYSDDTFHDTLICSKHTLDPVEICDKVNWISNQRLEEFEPTRSPIVEWIFRNSSEEDLEKFHIQIFPSRKMDLLGIQENLRTRDREYFLQYLAEITKEYEQLKYTDEFKRRVEQANEIKKKINFEDLEKYGTSL